MSKQNGEARLPKPFEEMLSGWPAPERDDAAWDESAERIAERLEAATAERTSDALLAAPLPPEKGEAGYSSDPRAAEAPPRSLAELARMSLEADAVKSDESDLARESFSLLTASRASAPSAPDLAAANAAAVAPPPAPVLPLPPKKEQRSAAGPLAMAAIGLLGLAAAGVIVVRAQRQGDSAPVTAVPAAAPAPTAAAQSTATPKEDIVALEELEPGKPTAAGPAARPSGEKLALKAGEPSQEEPKGQAKPEPPAAGAKAEDKKDDEAAKMKPALTAGDLPDKPSTGAVQAAIGSVMGSARACVAGHDEASRATITFGSDGRVQSVAVSGKAAGTPAEACIKAALGKARVQPFARPTFGVGAAIRP